MRLQLSGFKKVLNYTKKIMEDMRYRRTISREEVNILVQPVNLDALIHLIGLQAINTAELEIYLEEMIDLLKNIDIIFVY